MEVFLDQQFLSRKQSFFSAKDGIHLSPHGSQFWLLKAEKAWLCFNKIIGRVFFMDLLQSKSEKYAATVVTSWKTRLKKSCGFHQGFRGCLLDRGKTTAVDLWEVLTAKWLGWFHAKMQNTAATCLFFIDHWGPKKKSRQAKRLSKSRDGFIGCGHCGFLSKECWIRLHSIDKRVLSSKIHVTCNSQLGVFLKNCWGQISCESFCISSTWDEVMESSIQLGIKMEDNLCSLNFNKKFRRSSRIGFFGSFPPQRLIGSWEQISTSNFSDPKKRGDLHDLHDLTKLSDRIPAY